jgi:hypothetical protein
MLRWNLLLKRYEASARRGSAYAKAADNLAWLGRALRSACSCLNLILACVVY